VTRPELSTFTFRFQLLSHTLCVIERSPSILNARGGNSNLNISALARQIALRQGDWNAPAAENTWNNGFFDAEGQSHENDEFFWVRHVSL
jgi:hypothetical protein